MISVVVPVYRNEANIPDLLRALASVHADLKGDVEVVFVVDGSPDRSYALLRTALPEQPFRSKLVLLSRNFGSFAAIRAGFAQASGEFLSVMAADLQEPPELILRFREALATDDCDVVMATREAREDPLLSRVSSTLFWWFYRKFVQKGMPCGGLDVFACTRAFADQLLKLEEANSSLVGLVVWLGFRSKSLGYRRQVRQKGKSAWTFARKWKYLFDSIFAFTDLPFRVLSLLGTIAVACAVVISILAIAARLAGRIPVQGYTITVVLIMFFGGINAIGLSLLGGYLWRAFDNTKGRPNYLVASVNAFPSNDTVSRSSDGPTA
jgi:glycosyltransferase involved in cell wall biosynthesis